MDLVRVRKKHAGADSFGHVWPEDGAVVEMPYEQAMELLAIPDAGCSVVEDPVEAVEVAQVDEPATGESDAGQADETEPEANMAPKRRTRSRPTKAAAGGA